MKSTYSVLERALLGVGCLLALSSPVPSEVLILDEPGGVRSGNWEVGDSNPSGDAYPFGRLAYWGSFGGGTITASTPYGKSYCAAVNHYGTYERPYYRANMDAYASRSIDLRACLSATLRFYYAIPSIDGVDAFRVFLDNNLLFSTSSVQAGWREVTANLSPWIDGIHSLTFRFVSTDTNSKVPFEGVYLERVSVSVVPVQPEAFSLSNAPPVCLVGPSDRPAVDLHWSRSNGANRYDIYRNGRFHFPVLQGTSFRDSAVTAGSEYSYQVLAWNTSQTASTNSNLINVFVPPAVCLPVLSVIPDQRSVSSQAGNTTFSISNAGGGTMRYSASVTTGQDWLSVTSGTTGTNSSSLELAFPENRVLTERTGHVTVTATGSSGVTASGSPKTIAITQAARTQPGVTHVDCTYLGTDSDGSLSHPFPTISAAYQAAIDGDTLRILSCNYPETFTLSKPLRLEAPNGGVNIGLP